MQLGFRRVGQPYPFDALSVTERTIAGHMMQLGLLQPFRQPPPAAAKGIRFTQAAQQPLYFCPTRLASSLCGGFKSSSVLANADIAGGHIIVETNYRVGAGCLNETGVAGDQ